MVQMEALARIMNRIHQKSTISADMEAKEIEYKCNKCKDTGWILTEEEAYRKCECVDIERLKRLWKNSGIKSDEQKIRLEDYIPYDNVTKRARDKAVEYVGNFDDIRCDRENSFGLFGQPGAGKTHIVVSIGIDLLNRKPSPVPVVYMPYLEVIRELKANTNYDEYYLKLSNRYCRAKLLIIDDLFKDKVKKSKLVGEITEADMRHIYPILNYRYLNYLPTLISTECTPNMLLDLDEALAGRILETCGNNITVFKGQQYNYRMKKFMR